MTTKITDLINDLRKENPSFKLYIKLRGEDDNVIMTDTFTFQEGCEVIYDCKSEVNFVSENLNMKFLSEHVLKTMDGVKRVSFEVRRL